MGDQRGIKLHPSWLEPLGGEFDEPYMADLKRFLAAERERGQADFPKGLRMVPGARPDAAR